MAITTAVAVNTGLGTVFPGDTVHCLLTVTNGGATAVNVTGVEITAGGLASGHVVSKPSFAQGQAKAVPGSSGTLAIPFSIVPTSPLSNDGLSGSAATRVNSIATITYTDDAQAVADSSAATFTVTAPTYTAGG